MDREEVPSKADQLSVSDLLDQFDKYGVDHFINNVFNNRQRTSPSNGIPKGDAVLRFAQVVQRHGGEYLQDIAQLISDASF